jgi:quercetin dioxygenase-like cupin family protein
MRVVRPDEAPARRAPGGLGLRTRVLAGPAPLPAAEVGMVEVEVAPGAGLPTHAHGDAEAVVYVVAGRARLGGPDGEEEVAGGGAVHIPRGEPVAVTNAGADTLRLIAVFSPAGFERRFLGWDVRERTADRVAVGIRLDGPPPAGSAA